MVREDIDSVTRRERLFTEALSPYEMAQQRAYLETVFEVLGIVRWSIQEFPASMSTRLIVDFDPIALDLDRAYGTEERMKRAKVVWWQQHAERTRAAFDAMTKPTIEPASAPQSMSWRTASRPATESTDDSATLDR